MTEFDNAIKNTRAKLVHFTMFFYPENEGFNLFLSLQIQVVVDFNAAWCMPCKIISPIFEDYATSVEFFEVSFMKVDVDESPDIAQR
jgi:thiol-disulfide isomerase/thioredoxin